MKKNNSKRIQIIPISGEKELTPDDKNNIIDGLAKLFDGLGPDGKREAKLLREKPKYK